MRKIFLTLIAISILAVLLFLESQNRPTKSDYDAKDSLAVPIEVVDSHTTTPEERLEADPMTGVIAGEWLGGEKIEAMGIYEKILDFSIPVQYEGNRFRAGNVPAGQYRINIRDMRPDFIVNLAPGEVRDNLRLEDWKHFTNLKLEIVPGTAPPYRSRCLGMILTVSMNDGKVCTKHLFTDLPDDGIIDVQMPKGRFLTVHIMSAEMGGVLEKTLPIHTGENDTFTTALELEPWPEVTGRVLDKNQSPVQDASVRIEGFGDEGQEWLQYHPLWSAFHRKLETQSGPDGSFRLSLPRYWHANLRIKSPIHDTVRADHIEAGYEPFDIQLGTAKGGLTLTAKTPEGKPIQDIEIWLRSWNTGSLVEHHKKLNEQGLVEFHAIEPLYYAVESDELDSITPKSIKIPPKELIKISITAKINETAKTEDVDTGSSKNELTYTGRFEMVDGSPLPSKAFVTLWNVSANPKDSAVDGHFILKSQRELMINNFQGYSINLGAPGYALDYGWQKTANQPDDWQEGTEISEQNMPVLGICQAALGTGRIVSSTGAPIAGAVLYGNSYDPQNSAKSEFVGVSRHDGRFIMTLPIFHLSKTNTFGQIPPAIRVEHEDFSTTFFAPFETKAGQTYEFKDFVMQPKHEVRVEIKYENPNQKDLWTSRRWLWYAVLVPETNSTISHSQSGDTFNTFTPVAVSPYTYLELSPQDFHIRSILQRFVYRSWDESPAFYRVGQEIPESVTLIAEDLPLKRARLIDEEGNPLKETNVVVTVLQERRTSWISGLFSGKINPTMYNTADMNAITNQHGYFDFVHPSGTDIIVEAQTQKDMQPPPMGSSTITGTTLPTGLFRPKSGPDIGDLVLSATSSRGLRIATPE